MKSALTEARKSPFGTPPTAGLSPREAQIVTSEVNDASLYGFRYAITLGSLLVLLAGLLGAVGLRNPTCRDPPRRRLRGRPVHRASPRSSPSACPERAAA